MTDDSAHTMHEYVLEFSQEHQALKEDRSAETYAALSNTLLFENLFWYCRFRWMAIAGLLIFGIASHIPGWFVHIQLRTHLLWPFIFSVFLIIFNTLFILHAEKIRSTMLSRNIQYNIWSQIILDLILLTGVVHFAGSLDTPILFTYLFHIVLSCIFFTRMQSFLVAIMACTAFVSCVSLEVAGILPPSSIFGFTVPLHSMTFDPLQLFVPVCSSIAIWLVVWYLVSYLSDLTRQRDIELIQTNLQLSDMQKEEKKHFMWMAHELKAPLAAIDSNVTLMKEGYCGDLPEKALEVLDRISARSRKLGLEVKEMLELANIRTVSKEAYRVEQLDVSEVITQCLAQLKPSADGRNIRLESDLSTVIFSANSEHMKMLFMNVISNAINYSQTDGVVRIRCGSPKGEKALVIVEDQGIGIVPGKLSKIFDEYYHTSEAVAQNKNSTGLGLAIVKHIAQTYRLSILVASLPQVGTRFEIRFS